LDHGFDMFDVEEDLASYVMFVGELNKLLINIDFDSIWITALSAIRKTCRSQLRRYFNPLMRML
jgi:hypothetical protein